jgi:hypothetical protein
MKPLSIWLEPLCLVLLRIVHQKMRIWQFVRFDIFNYPTLWTHYGADGDKLTTQRILKK